MKLPCPYQIYRYINNEPSKLELTLANGKWKPIKTKIELAKRLGCSMYALNKQIKNWEN
jgi:hypothetical protein